MDDKEGDGNQYEFVPEHLRHHFRLEFFGGDEQERDEIRSARRTRSAHLVSSSLTSSTLAPKAPTPVFKLYTQPIEHAITSRMTFDRTLSRLGEYFTDISTKLKYLEETQPAIVPQWLYTGSVKLLTLLQVQRHIIQAAESCLNESDIYLAMFEQLPGPPVASPTPLLRFSACSSKSSMARQVLLSVAEDPPHSRSRSNQDHHESTSAQKQKEKAISFEVMEGLHEVVVEDIEMCSQKQIKRFTPQTRTGSFACFPLLVSSRRAAIGVLSLDSCRKALRLRPESMTVTELSEFLVRKSLKDAAIELRHHKFNGQLFLSITERDLNHKPMFKNLKINTRKRMLELIHALKKGAMVHLARPERYFHDDPDALTFLHNMSILSGAFLEGYRGIHWHQLMAHATRDSGCTVYSAYDVLLRGISQSVDFVERIVVWKIAKNPDVEVEVVASTQVPDDRLMPFLQWVERQIKRVVFYRESTDVHGSLVQGNIMRIIFKQDKIATPPTPDLTSMCESAFYQVSWSNRTVETLAWAQLRQLLPIRKMNVKHFQLTHLLERLEAELPRRTELHQSGCVNKGQTDPVRLDDPNAVAMVIHDSQRSVKAQFVLQVDFTSNYEIPQSGILFLRRAVAITEKSIACIRGRESRGLSRQLSSVRVSQDFHSMGLNPSADALRALSELVARFFKEITDNLPGVEIQVAELQPDGAQLRYTFADNGSTLLGKVLNRGQGVSFRCLDSKEPLVVRKDSDLRTRLRRLGHHPENHEIDDAEFPFVFLPLVHEDCLVGVLSVNRFADVPKGREDEDQPEAGVIEYLKALVKTLGTAIYLKRRSYALYELQSVAREPIRSPQQLMFYACRAVKDILVGAWKVRVVEVDCSRGKTSSVYEFSEAERLQEASRIFRCAMPIRFRVKEILPDTISKHFHLDSEIVNEMLAHVHKCDQDEEEDFKMLRQLEADCDRAAADALPASERRRLQDKKVAAKYLNMIPPDVNEAGRAGGLENRLSNEKYVNHALGVFLGSKTSHFSPIRSLALRSSSVYITSSNLPQFHASCEHNYIARVGETLSNLMSDLQQRIERSRARVKALESFHGMCERYLTEVTIRLASETDPNIPRSAPNLTPEEELLMEGAMALQQRTIELLESVFYQTNVYFGLLEPSLKLLRYTSASQSSSMQGKQLRHGYGVSFQVLETQVPFVATQRDADLSSEADDSPLTKIRFFAKEPKKQKWPFIAVPIGRFGVLGLDNLEKYERISCETQPEIGVVDFLRQIGSRVASVMETTRKMTKESRRALRAQALTRIMTACDDVKSRSPIYLQHFVIQEIARAINGVDAYIGMVQPLCERIRFTCASSRSCMENQVVNTVHSTSFRVFVTQRSLVLTQLQHHHHQEANDIIEIGKLRTFGSAAPRGPFVCVPIPFVGVLSVDTFPGASGGIYTTHFPERGVLEFLSRVANQLGENIRTHNAMAATKTISGVFQGNKSTLELVFESIVNQIASNLVAVEEIEVIRIASDSAEQVRSPLAVLKRSLLDKAGEKRDFTIDGMKESIVRSIQQRQESSESGDGDPEARCFVFPGAAEVLVGLLNPTRDVEDDSAECITTAIVLRRVKGATWMYDLEFLKSILPLVNDVIAQVNIRIEGIVARRLALQNIDKMSRHLEELHPEDAMETLPRALKDAIERIAQAMSRDNCDVYMGERTIGGEKLVFACASRESLMENASLRLSDEANRSLVSVQCLEQKHPAIVHLFDGKNEKTLRALTVKKCQRVYMIEPMGDDRILCADSLGMEAFHPKTRRLEVDIALFFSSCAKKLNEMILTTHYRRSYDQMVRLKSSRHPNFRLFFSTLLEIVRRDLVTVHSQQILTLASDFTGRYNVEAWHGAPTRRPLAHVSEHFCYLNDCKKHLIQQSIHHESGLQLPMTNLARTLDESRSSLQPVEGVEKRGAFACSCLATMLDAQMVAPRIALCVFTHDAKARAKTTTFTSNQRQYFFALAAVASDVFTHVYRNVALYSVATELFFYCRERLNAKEGFVVRVHSNVESSSSSEDAESVVLFSSQEAKYPRFSVLQGTLATKILHFYRSGAEVSIFVRKKLEASTVPSIGVPKESPPALSPAMQTPPSVDPKRKQNGASHSFFRRPDIFRSRKTKQEKQDHPPQTVIQQSRDSSSESQVQEQRFRFHVLLRGIDVHDQPEVLSFDIEHPTMNGAKVIEQAAKCIRTGAQGVVDRFVKHVPRGDEEMLGQVLGQEAGNSAYHVSTGGGFYFSSLLKDARQDFQQASLRLEPDIRGFLTGVQPTARESMISSRAPHDHKPLPPEPALKSIFSEDGDPALARVAMVLVEAAMVLTGYKKEALSKLDKNGKLKEYLRAGVGKKLLAMHPKDRKHWGAILRVKAFLQSHDKTVQQGLAPVNAAVPQPNVNAVRPRFHDGTDFISGATTMHTMWTLQVTLIAVVKYQKHLEVDSARQKRDLDRHATILQCFYRVARSKAILKRLRKQFAAARAIQCAFRQHLARRRALFMKWTRAAIKIQRAYRLKLLRKKGSRPKRLSDELLAISKRYGGLTSSAQNDAGSMPSAGDTAEWRGEMDSFGSFKEYLTSKAGKEQLKREEHVMTTRMHELAKEREKLSPEERVMEDVKDLFELLDTEGSGELSREVTREMMTRLRIPLAKEEADDVIDMMDNDRSGEISLTEFTNWFFHEYPLLKKRAKDCGVISRKDWQWVIENSARSALRKRWRALRVGQGAAPVSETTNDEGGAAYD